MGNRKIELDPECGPRSAITDLCLLDRRICIEDRLAIDLVHTCVEMTANIGQNRTLQIFIFQVDGSPFMFHAAARQVIA